MMDDITSLDRRRFLQQGTGTVAMATLSAGSVKADDASKALAFYRAHDADSVAFARAMQEQGIRTVELGDDVVRQWRDELQPLVVEQRFQILGRTGYADYFILRGLAAEHRLFPQHEHQPSQYNFDWII